MNDKKPSKSPKKKTESARFREIFSVFRKHNVVQNIRQQKNPQEVREAFEELGPTFIKIGQLLSVRPDLVTPEYITELKKLQDNVQTDSFQTVKETIEREMQVKIEDIFATFEEVPLASASMGQTHKATLKNGEIVVVKVQHPEIREKIELDFSLFEKVLPLTKVIPESNVVNMKELVMEIKHSLFEELDSMKEAAYGREFYEKNNGWLVIESPFVYQEYCTEKILVTEFKSGKSMAVFMKEAKISEEEGQSAYFELQRQVGNFLLQSFMKQIFVDGFFHADPHPGNVLIHQLKEEESSFDGTEEKTEKKQKNGSFVDYESQAQTQKRVELPPFRLIFLDFGMMGRLSTVLIDQLSQVILGLHLKNGYKIGKALLHLCEKIGPCDEEAFCNEIGEFFSKYYDMPISDMDLQTISYQSVEICHAYNLQIPREVTLLMKAFFTLEGIVSELDPELSITEVAEPFAKEYFKEKFSLTDEMKKSGLDLLFSLRALPKLPSQAAEVLESIAHGKAKVNLEIKRQDEWLGRTEQMVNRLVIGIILAALVIGSSTLVKSNAHTTGNFVFVLGMLGYGTAFLAILYLIIDTFRKRKK